MSSVILHSKNQILEPKNFHSEVRCSKDVANFLDDGLVLLDQTENDLSKLLLGIIRKVIHSFSNFTNSIVLSTREPESLR